MAHPASLASPTPAPAAERRRIGVLVLSNLLGGVGVASGVATGGLLVASVAGTSAAGLGQAANVLGAGLAAVPLAALAARSGRRWSLSAGYAIAVIGAGFVLVAALSAHVILLLVGLGLFGVATAANLQSRYAAADGVSVTARARVMSIVVWATTVGSVAGPNLAEPGARSARVFGLPMLAGPYVFSLLSFAAAGLVIALAYRASGGSGAGTTEPSAASTTDPGRAHATDSSGASTTLRSSTATGLSRAAAPTPMVSLAAMRWAASHPPARLAVVLIASAHAVMVMVMVMTPLQLQHHGMTLTVVGVVISLHTLGMYGLSPLFGWLTDRWGTLPTARFALGTLVCALALGFTAAWLGGSTPLTAVALLILGLGWSAATIAGSALLTETAAPHVRVPLQGAADAGMNYAGAIAAAVAGGILAFGGFELINTVAALLLLPAIVLSVIRPRRFIRVPERIPAD